MEDLMDRLSSWVRAGVALFACAAMSTACGPPAREPLGCEAGERAISLAFGAAGLPSSVCTTDGECMLHQPVVRCAEEDVEYTWCAYPVHRDDVATFDATLASVLADNCPRIMSGCRGRADCAPVVPRCLDGRCVALDAFEACVEGCSACLTRDSCTGHCGSHRDCILAATDCDAVRTCASGPAPDGGT